MELDDIRKHWEKEGEKLNLSERVTITSRDPFLGKLEEEFILQYLKHDQDVLEIGCGDAAHAVKYAKQVNFLWGLDIAQSLISLAQQRVVLAGLSNIKFQVGSVLEINSIIRRPIDCAISQRCLINLPDWRYQQQAIVEIWKLLKPKGLFLMTEGFQDELVNLNSLRQKAGLDSIKTVNYNRNLVHDEFDAFIQHYFIVEAVHHYGLYLFLSRVYHPLVVSPEQPKHDARLNEIASLLCKMVDAPELKKFSYNLFYVLRKRDEDDMLK